MTVALFFLRAKEMNLSIDEIDELSTGFIFDMITEQANDNCEYKRIATQEDMNRF